MKPCNLHIIKTLKLVEEMMDLADQGDADREDNGCGILYGVLRDSAYKLQKLAEEERKNHITKGWWHEEQQSTNVIMPSNYIQTEEFLWKMLREHKLKLTF